MTAGIFICVSAFGTSLGGSGASVGGFATGTVIFSLPGSSAFFGGSGDLLPPPPPPPPGPGTFNQMMSFGSGSGGATVSFAGGIRAMTKMKNRNAPRCVARDTTKLPPRRPFSLAPEGTSPTRKCAFGLGRGSGISDMSAVSGTVVIVADAVPGCKAAISMPQQHREHRRKSWPWEQERPRLRTATGDERPGHVRATGPRPNWQCRARAGRRMPGLP